MFTQCAGKKKIERGEFSRLVGNTGLSDEIEITEIFR